MAILRSVPLALILAGCSSTGSVPSVGDDGRPTLLADSTSKRISGRAVDEKGKALACQVALVSKSGSMSMGTGHGGFDFGDLRHDEYALSTWTEDGRWGLMPHVLPGTEGIVLAADQSGAFLEVTMTGRPTARLAILHEGVPFNDRTLREGKTQRFVVPAKGASYRLYGKELDRRGALDLDAGSSDTLRFDLGD